MGVKEQHRMSLSKEGSTESAKSRGFMGMIQIVEENYQEENPSSLTEQAFNICISRDALKRWKRAQTIPLHIPSMITWASQGDSSTGSP